MLEKEIADHHNPSHPPLPSDQQRQPLDIAAFRVDDPQTGVRSFKCPCCISAHIVAKSLRRHLIQLHAELLDLAVIDGQLFVNPQKLPDQMYRVVPPRDQDVIPGKEVTVSISQDLDASLTYVYCVRQLLTIKTFRVDDPKTGARRYNCPCCGKSYTANHSLKEHITF
ncbi:hypothetical protein HDV05_007281, partial [Chytridiales sp. JEL 0842]